VHRSLPDFQRVRAKYTYDDDDDDDDDGVNREEEMGPTRARQYCHVSLLE